MKTYGAEIYCNVCHAEPWPDDPATIRETFDLARIGDAWFCELHRPPKEKRASRVAAATPAEALIEFERTLSAECSRLEEAVGDDDGLIGALKDYSGELERGLASLRRAIVAREPAGDAPKPRRARLKPITARERAQPGQGSLIEEEASPRD